jgi:hypothetical protein
MENFASAELKLVSELTKAEKAIEFVQNSENIAKLKESLKILEKRNSEIELALIGQISPKYQPNGQKFFLIEEKKLGPSGTSWSVILKDTPKFCEFNSKQESLFSELIQKNTSLPKEKTSIKIIK